MAETYREIQVTETDSGAPVTAELTEAYRANVLAIAEGASGAPRVQRDGIANNAINRPKVQTDTSSVSGTVPGEGSVDIELNSFSFFPSIVTGFGDAQALPIRATGGGSASANDPKFNIQNPGEGDVSYDVAWRFIAAS